MNSTHDECYIRSPLFVDGDIPVFSESDSYVLNYDQISGDHVSEINNESANPWISDLVWNQMESVTLNLISKYAKLWPENDKVKLLDVGVGIGRLLKKTSEIQHTKFDVYGMDIAMPYLKLAKSKGLNVAPAIPDARHF